MKTLSTEAIKPQHNSKFIKDLIVAMTELKSMVKYKRFRRSIDLHKDKDGKQLISKIDNIVKDGIGVQIKHVYGSGIYAVIPLRFDKATALEEDGVAIMDSMKRSLKHCDMSVACEKDLDTDLLKTTYSNSEVNTMLAKTIKNIEELKKSMTTKELVIDFDNAKISGFNQLDPVFVITDFVHLFKDLDLTPRNIVAILMHEMGHVFTHLASVHRDVRQTTLLLETLKDNIDSKGAHDTLKLIMKENKITAPSDNVALVDMTNVTIKKIIDEDVLSYTDSEQMADQFSTRFGLGADLVDGLHKVGAIYKSYNDNMVVTTRIMLMTYVVYLVILAGVAFAMTIASLYLMITSIVSTVLKIATGTSDSNETVYDSDVDRYRRVKQDIIRQLRTFDLPKTYVTKSIADIERIEKMMLDLDTDSILRKFGDYMPWNFNASKNTKLMRLLENTSENDLHVIKHKLEQL